MAEELKACPFCGGPCSVYEYDRNKWAADCNNCNAGYRGLMSREAAIEHWNTRAQLPSQGGEAVEVVAHMWQHDETGRVGFVDQQQVDWGFEKNNPRLHLCGPLMTVAQHQRILAASAGSADPVAWAVTARKKGVSEQRAMWRDEQEADDWLSHFVGRGCAVTKTPLYTHPADQVAEPDAELVELLREALPALQHISDTAQNIEDFTLAERVRAKLASLKGEP